MHFSNKVLPNFSLYLVIENLFRFLCLNYDRKFDILYCNETIIDYTPNTLFKSKRIPRKLAGFFISTNIFYTMVSRKLSQLLPHHLSVVHESSYHYPHIYQRVRNSIPHLPAVCQL